MSYKKFPQAFDSLRSEVRIKAIEIAAVLIENGFDSEISYAIAYTNSRLLANNYQTVPNLLYENPDLHLVPHPEGWTIIREDASVICCREADKAEAMVKARNLAKSLKVKLFVHASNGLLCDCESFKVNKPCPENLPVYSKPGNSENKNRRYKKQLLHVIEF